MKNQTRKYIICDNRLILGEVDSHKDLIPKDAVKPNIIGGGYWRHKHSPNTLYFYGESDEFGGVTENEFKDSQKKYMITRTKHINFTDSDDLII